MARWAFVLALLSLAFAPAPLPRRAARPVSDEQRIVGCWARIDTQGGPTDRWVFFADGKMEIQSGTNRYPWTYQLDPTATPRGMDMTYRPGGNQDSVLRTVYEFHGDALKVAYDPGNWAKRPSSEAAAAQRMTFRRER